MTQHHPYLEDGTLHRSLQMYRSFHRLDTSHTCPQMPRVQCRHSGHTHISPCCCKVSHPQMYTPPCWCCSYSTALSIRVHKHTLRSRTLHGLRRAPHGSEHRSNCHTRSRDRRCAQNWMHDTHTVHSSTAPDHCIFQTHCLRGSCSTKCSPHYIRTALPGSPADIRTRRTGKPLGPQCTGCCLTLEAAGSHRNKGTALLSPNCPEGLQV